MIKPIIFSTTRFQASKTMKTVEGYEIPKILNYTVFTIFYTHQSIDSGKTENGFCGYMINTNVDDRFPIPMFCIWNKDGKLVHIDGKWELRDYYSLVLESININDGR